MERRPNAVRFAVLVALLLPAVVGIAGPSLTTHATDDGWRATCNQIDPPFDIAEEIIACLDAVLSNIADVPIEGLIAVIQAFTQTIKGIGQNLQDWGHSVHLKEIIQVGKIVERFATILQSVSGALERIVQLPTMVANWLIGAANQIMGNIQSRLDQIAAVFEDIGSGGAALLEPIVDALEWVQNTIEEAFAL